MTTGRGLQIVYRLDLLLQNKARTVSTTISLHSSAWGEHPVLIPSWQTPNRLENSIAGELSTSFQIDNTPGSYDYGKSFSSVEQDWVLQDAQCRLQRLRIFDNTLIDTTLLWLGNIDSLSLGVDNTATLAASARAPVNQFFGFPIDDRTFSTYSEATGSGMHPQHIGRTLGVYFSDLFYSYPAIRSITSGGNLNHYIYYATDVEDATPGANRWLQHKPRRVFAKSTPVDGDYRWLEAGRLYDGAFDYTLPKLNTNLFVVVQATAQTWNYALAAGAYPRIKEQMWRLYKNRPFFVAGNGLCNGVALMFAQKALSSYVTAANGSVYVKISALRKGVTWRPEIVTEVTRSASTTEADLRAACATNNGEIFFEFPKLLCFDFDNYDYFLSLCSAPADDRLRYGGEDGPKILTEPNLFVGIDSDCWYLTPLADNAEPNWILSNQLELPLVRFNMIEFLYRERSGSFTDGYVFDSASGMVTASFKPIQYHYSFYNFNDPLQNYAENFGRFGTQFIEIYVEGFTNRVNGQTWANVRPTDIFQLTQYSYNRSTQTWSSSDSSSVVDKNGDYAAINSSVFSLRKRTAGASFENGARGLEILNRIFSQCAFRAYNNINASTRFSVYSYGVAQSRKSYGPTECVLQSITRAAASTSIQNLAITTQGAPFVRSAADAQKLKNLVPAEKTYNYNRGATVYTLYQDLIREVPIPLTDPPLLETVADGTRAYEFIMTQYIHRHAFARCQVTALILDPSETLAPTDVIEIYVPQGFGHVQESFIKPITYNGADIEYQDNLLNGGNFTRYVIQLDNVTRICNNGVEMLQVSGRLLEHPGEWI